MSTRILPSGHQYIEHGVVVFGANEAGIHGAGAAKDALDYYGALWGKGFGPAGRSFAIPTKDWNIQTLPLDAIGHYIRRFLAYAKAHPDDSFLVTPIGTGLAGYTAEQIAPFFAFAPKNCYLQRGWRELAQQAWDEKYSLDAIRRVTP
jgi:hypothetical protein